eukprot:g33992.t1
MRSLIIFYPSLCPPILCIPFALLLPFFFLFLIAFTCASFVLSYTALVLDPLLLILSLPTFVLLFPLSFFFLAVWWFYISRSSHACSYCLCCFYSPISATHPPILRYVAPDYVRSITLPDLDLELDEPVDHPMFLEIAPTIDRLRALQRAFPTTAHSNSFSFPIPLNDVLPDCSPTSDVSLRGRAKNDAHLQKCFTSLLNRVRLFNWLSSIDSSAPLPHRVRVRCQGNEASIPLTCPPIDRSYHLTDPQWDLMAQRR